MKKIELEQGSLEWKEYRRKRIGASEAAVVLGISPWKTPYQLWEEKISGAETAVNAAMQIGSDNEPVARNLFNERWEMNMQPAVYEADNGWQMASLDGIDGDFILEIKCGGARLFVAANNGEIPEYYMAQMQHQMMVTDIKKAFYCCFYEGEITVCTVDRDDKFIAKLHKAEEEFYNCLQYNEAPPLTDRDYVQFDHPHGSDLLKQYQAITAEEKALKAKKDSIKEELLQLGPERNFILDGVKIYQSQNTSYDFEKMRADGINLNDYKKLSARYWMINGSSKRKAS